MRTPREGRIHARYRKKLKVRVDFYPPGEKEERSGPASCRVKSARKRALPREKKNKKRCSSIWWSPGGII